MKKLTTLITVLYISLTASASWGQTLTLDDLVERGGLYYKKFIEH